MYSLKPDMVPIQELSTNTKEKNFEIAIKVGDTLDAEDIITLVLIFLIFFFFFKKNFFF